MARTTEERRVESKGVSRITDSFEGPPPPFGHPSKAGYFRELIGRETRYLGHVYDGTHTIVTYEVIDRGD
jgi:hypothetical protein